MKKEKNIYNIGNVETYIYQPEHIHIGYKVIIRRIIQRNACCYSPRDSIDDKIYIQSTFNKYLSHYSKLINEWYLISNPKYVIACAFYEQKLRNE